MSIKEIVVPAKELRWLTDPAFKTKKREVNIIITDSVSVYNTFWDGGSKNSYKVVKIGTDQVAELATGSSPWFAIAEGKTIQLEQGFAIVEESVYCGKIMKLRVYLHPSNVAAYLKDK